MRLAGGALALVAVLLYFGAALPLRQRAATAGDDYRRLRDQRREARTRVQHVERQDAFRERAASMLAAAGDPVTPRIVRRALVGSLDGAAVSQVRLSVQPGRPPIAASVRLTAVGEFDDIVRLAGHVVRPGTGLVLEQVRLSPRAPQVLLDLEAVGIGGRR